MFISEFRPRHWTARHGEWLVGVVISGNGHRIDDHRVGSYDIGIGAICKDCYHCERTIIQTELIAKIDSWFFSTSYYLKATIWACTIDRNVWMSWAVFSIHETQLSKVFLRLRLNLKHPANLKLRKLNYLFTKHLSTPLILVPHLTHKTHKHR